LVDTSPGSEHPTVKGIGSERGEAGGIAAKKKSATVRAGNANRPSEYVFEDELSPPLSMWQGTMPPTESPVGVYFTRRRKKLNWPPLVLIGGAILSLVLLAVWLLTHP
jgi:hypothetical protein